MLMSTTLSIPFSPGHEGFPLTRPKKPWIGWKLDEAARGERQLVAIRQEGVLRRRPIDSVRQRRRRWALSSHRAHAHGPPRLRAQRAGGETHEVLATTDVRRGTFVEHTILAISEALQHVGTACLGQVR